MVEIELSSSTGIVNALLPGGISFEISFFISTMEYIMISPGFKSTFNGRPSTES
ncbi:hypothetical protein D3C77_749790 [compost metagenome]